MTRHRIYDTPVASVYPHYVAKAERKGRTRAEVDEVIVWLTGYDTDGLRQALADEVTSRSSSPPPRPSTRPRGSSPARCAACACTTSPTR